MIKDRRKDIKRKNEILLERIAFQMVKDSQTAKNAQNEHHAEAIKKFYEQKRKSNNAMIASQNAELYARINSKEPSYGRYDWLTDRRKNLGYLKNISRFPKHYSVLINEFDNNEEISRIVKPQTRPSTSLIDNARALSPLSAKINSKTRSAPGSARKNTFI